MDGFWTGGPVLRGVFPGAKRRQYLAKERCHQSRITSACGILRKRHYRRDCPSFPDPAMCLRHLDSPPQLPKNISERVTGYREPLIFFGKATKSRNSSRIDPLNVGCENGECISVCILVLAIGLKNSDDDVLLFSIDKVYLGGCDLSVEEVKNNRPVLPWLQFADRHFFSLRAYRRQPGRNVSQITLGKSRRPHTRLPV